MTDFQTLGSIFGDEVVRLLKGEPPPVRKCETRAELARWFTTFALACQHARTAP
jgi:hypothetical protein